MNWTGEELAGHGGRVRRLRELDWLIGQIRGRMQELAAEFNTIFARSGVRSRICRARVHAVGGRLAIRYETGSRSRGNATTLSAITDGSGWSIHVADEKRKELVDLDRRRRILNHQYSAIFSERKSLKRLHQDESELRAFLRKRQFQD